MKITSVSLPADLTDKIDRVAHASERSRSFVIRKLLEKAVTGEERLEALRLLAEAELEAGNSITAPIANPGDVIAAASVDGHARLATLGEIAASNRKAIR